jgi:hypothetical protein
MAGHTPFQVLLDKMAPERQAKINARVAKLKAEMTLAELRQARQLTQETLGETLQVGQASIAKMEKRTDMYVSNLRRFVNAMGGELDIVARFPDGDVKINNFSDIGAEFRGAPAKATRQRRR